MKPYGGDGLRTIKPLIIRVAPRGGPRKLVYGHIAIIRKMFREGKTTCEAAAALNVKTNTLNLFCRKHSIARPSIRHIADGAGG